VTILNRRKFLESSTLSLSGLLQTSKPPFSIQASPSLKATLKKGSSAAIAIHPWDITDEGIDTCFNFLGERCGLNELFLASIYHASTFLLPHNPKRMVRWDDGSAFFVPNPRRWRDSKIRPVIGECVDTPKYLHNIVDNARRRKWGVLFFTVFHFSHSMARAYPHCTMVDAFGERNRASLCPAHPDVRAYDLAVVEELMETYGGDGILFESIGYDRWNYGFVVNKVEVLPSSRDQYLLSLCFCDSCCDRARVEEFDANAFKKEVRAHLYASLSKPPEEWDTNRVDEEWCRNAFDGKLWNYMKVRLSTVTSLLLAIQEIVNKFGGALMWFDLNNERNILNAFDASKFYSYLKRVSIVPRGDTWEARKASVLEQAKRVPAWAEPEMMHNQRDYHSKEELRRDVMMARETGIRHHSFHYYGMSRRNQLEWIGYCRDAWS
jgi:hypothetical protein